jgi:hypothetical protein
MSRIGQLVGLVGVAFGCMIPTRNLGPSCSSVQSLQCGPGRRLEAQKITRNGCRNNNNDDDQ